jgi:hypothetical protein
MKEHLLIAIVAASLCLSPAALAEEPAEAPSSDSVDTNVPGIVKYERDADRKEVEVIDLPFIEGYDYERDGERRDVEVLDVPFASVLKAHRDGEDDSSFKFIHVPFVTVAKGERDEDGQSFALLDVPFVSLVKTESDADGNFDRRAVSLPILGSLFRHSREGDKETARFLFFKHSWKNEVSGDEDTEAPSKHKRSNAHPG